MAVVVAPRLRFDREADAAGRDRHRVDVSRAPPPESVPYPPSLGLKRCENTAHLVLRLPAHPAATGQTEPVARVEAEGDGGEQQQPSE